MRAYMNAVKQTIYTKLLGDKRVLDLGFGRAQDLYKYFQAGVKDIIGVDGDIQAL